MPDKKKKEIFVARQPIFDINKNIFGYELLFRSGLENFFDESLDKDFASSKTLLDSLLVFGLDDLTMGKKMFMNFTEKVLLSELATAFPRELLIVELLENIVPTPEVIDVCQKLKKLGFVLALDDYEYTPTYRPLVDLADIIKVDFLATTGLERQTIMERSDRPIQYLAEKIENNDEFEEAVELGYTYFQGFFFCKPIIVSSKDVPSYKMNLLQILRELNEPYINIDKIEETLGRDVSLSYKLMRFINSPAFGLAHEVRSIRHALNLLGFVELKKWMSLIVLSQMGSDKPGELMVNSIVRAKFCELIADQSPSLKDRKKDLFLMGLFSFIDTFLNRPMDEVLAELPLSADIKDALLGEKNRFRDVLEFIVMYEKGNWEGVAGYAAALNLDNGKILPNYLTAIKWANEYSQEGEG